MQFDSKEEEWFSWWLDELKDRGYVKHYDRAISFSLFEAVKELKLRGHEYTPDFEVCWKLGAINELKLGIHNWPLLAGFSMEKSIIEIKPSFDAHNMTRLFKLNQKWVYSKYGIYVELVIPEKLFEKTFCPDRFRYTDSGKGLRKLKQSYLNIDDYIKKCREAK
jgi:hypothetical protein